MLDNLKTYFRANPFWGRVFLVSLAAWLLLSVWASIHYPGNTVIFLLFSLTFMFMWSLAWFGPTSYLYIFLSIFWTLGFWMKTTLHLILGYDFVEPIGAFQGTAVQWDAAMSISIAGCCGLIFAHLISIAAQTLLPNRASTDTAHKKPPAWFRRHSRLIWTVLIFITISLSMYNIFGNILRVGLIPKVILPFPGNAIVSFLMGPGFALYISVLFWWQFQTSRKLTIWWIVPVMGAMVTTISVLSRGSYIFYIIPYFLVIYFNRGMLKPSRRFWSFFSTATALCFLISFVAVSLQRPIAYLMDEPEKAPVETPATAPVETPAAATVRTAVRQIAALPGKLNIPQPANFLTKEFLYLASDRWVGLEGVMAISSLQEQGLELLAENITERFSPGRQSRFDRDANSIYGNRGLPDHRYQFHSIPGITAFLYYSGSKFVVFAGIALLGLLFLSSEIVIRRAVRNPFLLGLYGIFIANNFAQFANAYMAIIQIAGIWSTIFLIWIIQDKLNPGKHPL